MAEDLGTWPPEQARVLVEVLQEAGIIPDTKRTREGIEVAVEESEADQAHATLVANMDAIARAARSSGPESRRRPRNATVRKRGEEPPAERPLTSQRLSRFARPVALLVAALMLSLLVPPPLRLVLLAAAVLGIVWMVGRASDEDPDGR